MTRLRTMGRGAPAHAPACVAGGIEIVRALGKAGIRSIVLGPDSERARLSRYAVDHPTPAAGPIVDALASIARETGEPPVLFTDRDDVIVELSGERERLSTSARMLLPPRELILDLVDKERFQHLAERLDLRVPRGRRVRPGRDDLADVGLRFPILVKPVPYRNERWQTSFGGAKALRIERQSELADLELPLAETGLDLLAQELVPGDETQIVSYHVYVDSGGAVAGEFTGRKIRTNPAEFGMSSALVTTDDERVAHEGRAIVARLGLVGPAKLDFKLDAEGQLHLLEVNARFTLWVHPGAVAGVNLPAIAYADLTGGERPARARARPGVRWFTPRSDLAAARAHGISTLRWLSWALRCETSSGFTWSDPGPVIRGRLAR